MAEEWVRRPSEPYEPGNLAAAKHLAYSERTIRPIADALASELPRVAPWTNREAYAPTIAAWAASEAQLRLVDAWIDEHGPLDEDGVPRPANTLRDRLEGRAGKLREQLGLTPMSLARLLRAFAAAPPDHEAASSALDDLRAEGRKALEARDGDG